MLDVVGGQRHTLAALSPERDRVLGGPRVPGPVWTFAANVALTGIRSPDRPAHSESIRKVFVLYIEYVRVVCISVSVQVAAFNWATTQLSQAADMSYAFVLSVCLYDEPVGLLCEGK